MRKLFLSLFTMLLIAFGPSLPSARAALTFNLDVFVNGDLPDGTSPWLTATFENIAGGGVQLTMTNNMPSYQFVDDVVFNSIIDPTTLTFTNLTVPPPLVNNVFTSATQLFNGGPQIKAGLFNINLDYAPPPGGPDNVWSGGMTSVWNITGAGLTADDFLLRSLADASMIGGPYFMAAHVQGIPGSLSASIAAVPEPGTYAMLLAGLGLVACIARRRMNGGFPIGLLPQ